MNASQRHAVNWWRLVLSDGRAADPRVSNACAEAQLSQLSVLHTRSLIQPDGDFRSDRA